MKYRMTRRTVTAMVVSAFLSFGCQNEAVQAAHRGAGLVAPGFSIPLALNNLDAGASYAAPRVSYGHAFADGDVPAGGSVTITNSLGNPVLAQMDAVALWPSGSPRFAVISHACAETFAASSTKNYTLGVSATAPNNTPAAGWGGTPSTTMAANSDFKAIYSGFDAAASTYTVSLNTIMSTYPRKTAQDWGLSYPSGGWEYTKAGPVCIEFHGWQYIKNDSTAAPHGYVRCDLWVKAWSPTGPFEIDVQTSMPNMWGTVPNSAAAEQFGNLQGRWATLLKVQNASAVIQNAGTTDPLALVVAPANFNTTTNRLSNITFFPQTGVAFASTGTLPSGITANTLYWPALPGSPAQGQPYLCIDRTTVSVIESGNGGNAWAPGAGYVPGQYRKNGNTIYRCTVAGTSAASGGPTGSGSAIVDNTCQWENVTIIFGTQGTATITAYPVNAAFPSSGWLPGDINGDPLWAGAGARPQIFPGHDFTYLTTKSKFTPCYSPNAGLVTTNQALPVYYPMAQFGGVQWALSATGDGAGDQRIGYISGNGVVSICNPTDPYYVRAAIQGALNWAQFPVNFMNDESGGNPFVGNNGTNNSGTPYTNLPALIPNWNGNNIAGNVSAGLVARGAQWSGWSQANDDLGGMGGQYYASPAGSHMPALWQIAYLKTGRPCFLEQGIQMANTQCFMSFNGKVTLSGTTRYCLVNGLNNSCQLRAWAWGWRSLCQALFICPASHIFFPVLRDYYNDNIAYQAGRLAAFPVAQARFGIVNCLDHGTTGNTSQGHVAPWMGNFLYMVVAMEVWRGGLTGATAGGQFLTLMNYMAKQWDLFIPAVDPNAVNYIGAYDFVYAATAYDYANTFATADAVWDASFSQTAQVTGSIAGTVLSVSAKSSGNLAVNSDIFTAGGNPYGYIVAPITGVNAANITASITLKVMTVSAVNSGVLAQGQVLNGGGVAPSTIVGTQISGPAGGAGDYNVNISQTLASSTILADTTGGVGTYAVSASNTLSSTTIYADSQTASVVPGPKYLSYLYDQNGVNSGVHANFPENCNWYGSIARCALAMHQVAAPGNATVIALLASLKGATAAATGVSPTTGGILWTGNQGGLLVNFPTFAIGF